MKPKCLHSCLNSLRLTCLATLAILSSVAPGSAQYTTSIDDGADLYQRGAPGPGLPSWRVSEPFISLWIQDAVVRYTTSAGKAVNLDVAYRQRGAVNDTNMFGFGPDWVCSWLSSIVYEIESDGGPWYVYGVDSFSPPLGGSLAYTPDGSTPEYNTYSRLSHGPVQGPPCRYAGFLVIYPDGTEVQYDDHLCESCSAYCVVTNYLSWIKDPQGRQLTFNYTSNHNVLQLTSVVDYDNRTSLFFYDSTFPNQISAVVDPYLRTNRFLYDSQRRLTNIINPEGMSCSFMYDSQGVITNMTTAYGATSFNYTANTNVGNVVNRSMSVIEPDGRTHLFAYRGQSTYLNTNSSTPLIPFSFPTNQVPNTAPLANTFDNTWMDARNSFYWSPHCYSQLSASFLQSGDFNNLTANDYLLAAMRHWLLETTNGASLGNTLSMGRQASPDGVVEGQKVWFDYSRKPPTVGTNLSGQTITNYYSNGDTANPSFVALVLPDATTRFGYSEYNVWGLPSRNINTYSSASGVTTRTNTFGYASNGNDLTQIYGTSGELLVSNVFNATHQITASYDALNEMTTVTYAGIQVSTVIAPNGVTVSNVFYSTGPYANFLQATIVLQAGATNTFTYTNGLLYTHSDERGVTTTNAWDRLLRPTTVSAPNGTVTFTYTNMLLSGTVDQLGRTNTWGYDSTGKKLWQADPLGRTTRFSYFPWGGLQAATNALGQSTTWIYDNLGRTLRSTGPDGATATNQFNLLGQLTESFDPLGNFATHFYNNQGMLTLVSNAYGVVQAAIYDIKDRPTSTADASGITNSLAYDILNRVLTSTAPDGGVQKFGYNVFGLSGYTNEIGQFVHYGYDSAGRLASETNANNEVMQYFYDQSGILASLMDGKNQQTKWGYDQFGRMTNKVDAAGNTNFVLAYDTAHRLTNRWSAAKGNTAYGYDAVGNLTSVVYPTSPALSFFYDALNRPTNMVDAVGTSKFQYTSFGGLLSEDGPWSDDTVSYSYAPNRRLSGLSLQQPSASPWTQSIAYDLANRVQSITSPAGAFSYAYQLAGGLVNKIGLPTGGYITNAFDLAGRLKATFLKNTANGVLDSDNYSYDLSGQATNHLRNDGSYLAFAYDNIGQLTTANGFESGGTPRLHEKFGCSYDKAGNLAFRTNNALVHTFNLNSLNHLTTITRAGTMTVAGTTTSAATNVAVNSATANLYNDHTFAKDSVALADGANTFTAAAQHVYGRSDSSAVTVTLPAAVTFTYDLNGNLTSDGSRGFDYDDDDQLIRVTVTNGWKAEFTYDGMGRRRIKTEFAWQSGSWLQTNQLRYVYSGGLVIQERGANNLPRVSYTRGLDDSGSFDGAGGIGGLLARTDNGLLAISDPGAHAYYYGDGSGNITTLINAQQAIVAKYLYDPFGRTLSQSGPLADANAYRFSSKEQDAGSGLYYFGLRFYEPNLQRWLNRDPIGEEGGINLYAFAGNNAVGAVDPWGMVDEDLQVHAPDTKPDNNYSYFPFADYPADYDFEHDAEFTNWRDSTHPYDLNVSISTSGQAWIDPGESQTPGTTGSNPGAQAPGSGYAGSGSGFAGGSLGGGGATGSASGGSDAVGVGGRLGGIAPPSGVLGYIPLIGSGWQAASDFSRGHWIMGSFHSAMAISDVFLVKGAVVAVGKIAVAGVAKLLAEDVGKAALNATYKVGVNSARPTILQANRGLYDAFVQSGGKFIRDRGTIELENGVQVFGRFNSVNKTITLYRGSNLGTVSHELIHFSQIQSRGYFGRAFPPELQSELESGVQIVLQQWGFVK